MRVIAGRLGGRELCAPKGRATRPTTDRVREALFSMLGDLSDLCALDLYAGSGALGIEALSRGARHATFVESARPALAALRDNLARLDLKSSATVIEKPVERAGALIRSHAPYDLVLCDPPWDALERAVDVVSRLWDAELLAPGGRAIFEHPTRHPVELASEWLELSTRRKWGDTAMSIYVAKGGQALEKNDN
jgi:16S rRNA (guanine(966)-N(2))-methyltransferase RsmD